MLDLESKFAKIIIDLRMIRPFYSALYESIEKIESDSVTTIGVTSSKLYYNKDFLDSLYYNELLFVILHEIAHLALKHPLRIGNRIHKIYNIACDLYVNKLLHEEFKLNSLGESSDKKIKMPSDAWYFDTVDTTIDCVESIYEELLRNNKDSDGGYVGFTDNESNNVDTSFRGNNIKGYVDNHLINDNLDETEQDNNISRILSNAVTKHDMTCKEAGNNPGILEISVREMLKSHLDWKKLLRKYCVQCRQSETSFAIPDNRMSYQKAIYPGHLIEENNKLKDVKVCIDTSGSISEEDLMYILGQVNDITKQYQMSFEILCWDTIVQKAYNAQDIKTVLNTGLAGGGGTKPSCIFEYFDAKRLNNNLVLIFTDGYFSTHDFKPNWSKKYKNTIWVMTRDCNKSYKQPFGKKAIAKFI